LLRCDAHRADNASGRNLSKAENKIEPQRERFLKLPQALTAFEELISVLVRLSPFPPLAEQMLGAPPGLTVPAIAVAVAVIISVVAIASAATAIATPIPAASAVVGA
jgi:hypothetical protein